MRRFLPLVVALAVVAAACGDSSTATVDEAAPGDSAAPEDNATDDDWPHDFVATALDGSTIEAGDYEGQDLVLWFWAPW